MTFDGYIPQEIGPDISGQNSVRENKQGQISEPRVIFRIIQSFFVVHNPFTTKGRLRIKKTFLASGPAALRLPEYRRSQSPSPYSGWRFGSRVACFLAGLCLTANVLFLIVATTIVHAPTAPNGIRVLFKGDCGKTRTLDTWIHVILNGMSTALVGASNYSMQCLSAPNRKEVDKAHARGIWLDIGVLSVRNLRHIGRSRSLLWIILAISTGPVHLLWNSTIFSTLQTDSYLSTVASPDILFAGQIRDEQPDCTSLTTTYQDIISDLCIAAQAPNILSTELVMLEPQDCIRHYGSDFQTRWSNLIAVSSTNRTSPCIATSDPCVSLKGTPLYIQEVVRVDSKNWICRDLLGDECNSDSVLKHASHWTIHLDNNDGDDEGWAIDYCLATQVPEQCQLQFSLPIILIVMCVNTVKLLAMLATLKVIRAEQLITLGDAVASFLDEPDTTTAGLCLETRTSIVQDTLRLRKVSRAGHYCTDGAKFHKPSKLSWSQAPSARRGLSILTLYIITLTLVATFLVVATTVLPPGTTIWSLGFGSTNLNSLFFRNGGGKDPSSTRALIGTVLLANLPQLAFSMLYFLHNSAYTCMLAASEWSRYASNRKGLRVSNPRGSQRSTYWLQLPWSYSLPLSIAASVMHWLISQSIFLVRIDRYDPYHKLIPDGGISACGYSASALVPSLCLGGVLFLALLVNSMRRLDTRMPLVGSCSLAISAACHRPVDDRRASPLPLQWGAVSHEREGRPGHCCFTSFEVESPVVGQRYA